MRGNVSHQEVYDLIIVGGGIIGTAILYIASRYTNLGKVALFEKHLNLGTLNSSSENNSQTLHMGDIETNYSLEKARRVKTGAELLKNYIEHYAPPTAFRRIQKMVLAVGGKEVEELEKRYKAFKNDYPGLRKLNRSEIADLEPRLIEKRDSNEPLLALASECYAVDFGAVSALFVRDAQRSKRPPDLFLNTEVYSVEKNGGTFELKTSRGAFWAKTVIVAAGPQSLVFAKQLRYGNQFGVLPVAGNFYSAKNILRGKVYMMQIPGMPFAAIHGDPDVKNPAETRFGPTIRVLPLLERHNYQTFKGFFRTSVWSIPGILSLIKITANPVILRYIIKNLIYDLPFVGKYLFVRWELQKIVPSLRSNEVTLLRGKGGIRPQVINTVNKTMEFGESEIVGDNIIFSITPSPGASVCLAYAEKAVQKVADFLGDNVHFDKKRFLADLSAKLI